MLRKWIYLALMITLGGKSLISQNPNWVVSGIMPLPVAGAQTAVHDSLIYIIGGYTDPNDIQGSLLELIQVYDPRSGAWDSVAYSLDVGRAGFAAGVHQEQLYFGGGVWNSTGQPFIFSIDCWDFGDTLTSLQFNPQYNRVNTTGLVHNGKLYMIGGAPVGTSPVALNYVVEFDIATRTTLTFDTLYPAGNLPIQQMATRIGDDIYIFGGYFFGVSGGVMTFNTVNHTFSRVGDLNRERAGGAAVAVDARDIYIIGGYNENPAQPALDSLTIYNTHSGGIEAGPRLNWGRSDLMAAKYGDSIYIFGGFDNNLTLVPIIEKLEVLTGISSTGPPPGASADFSLEQNYPNPFNPETVISYRLSVVSDLTLAVYNLLGEKIVTLVDARQGAGRHQVRWNGRDENGQPVSSGVYLYRLRAGNFVQTRKMMLVR